MRYYVFANEYDRSGKYGERTETAPRCYRLTITAARKEAYYIVRDVKVARCVIKTETGIKVGEVTEHHAGHFEGTRFFYPDYYGYYKNSKMKYHKYFLKADGTLGKGTW